MGLLDFFQPRKFSVFASSRDFFVRGGVSVDAFLETTSTNDIAKSEAFSISEPLKVYLVDQQTQGRGRGGNSWSNARPGDSLMITFSFFVSGPPQAITGPLVGLALYDALTKTWPELPAALKAPNDIYIGSKKVGGLLVEAIQMGTQHRLLIGLGLNVFSGPDEVPDAAFLAETVKIRQNDWMTFLKNLHMHFQWAAQGCLTPHLSDSERQRLLDALNKNDNLPLKFKSVTPFGDLVTDEQTISWRSL